MTVCPLAIQIPVKYAQAPRGKLASPYAQDLGTTWDKHWIPELYFRFTYFYTQITDLN